MGRVREEKRRRKKIKEEKLRRKKIQVRERVGKSQNCVFPVICGSGGSKSRLAKVACAEPSGQMGDKKLHASAVRSTCPSQSVQSTAVSEHFQKLRRRKSAPRCAVKLIHLPSLTKSKCSKHRIFGPLLEAEMSKQGTRS